MKIFTMKIFLKYTDKNITAVKQMADCVRQTHNGIFEISLNVPNNFRSKYLIVTD